MNQQLNISDKEFDSLTLYEKQILLELQYILKTCEQIKENLKKAISITNKEGELHHKQILAIESMKVWEKIRGNVS
ncbi:hypothetical protein PNEG_00422 [Pneumocystis murina B123]|uniref:Uncharacterized protein n=1 Tax=Pneumocystis murina (strain B123) TaxID=1069680 RepID=M7PLR3_PNEMU|nr:hypothetical protein PNEG_00422 [Pneumocystis murina B123]EMR11399.1 hypothetical protein PNEG_00422 [Pneumocystis murina B123]